MAHRLIRLLRWLLFLTGAGTVACTLASLYVEYRWADRILPRARAPEAPVALVFGAGLRANQAPSPMLAERIDTAIALYQAGKVKALLMSGDNSDRSHDETRAMRRYAIGKGVPSRHVIGDYAGLSTYDSCYRARSIFGVERALLVTQQFHLPRALFIAQSLGIDAFGVSADEARPHRAPYPVRELLARPWAVVMVLLRPAPRFLGEPEPIPP
jgi:SanA protein